LGETALLFFCGGGFGGFDFCSGVGVLFGEAFDAACGVNQLLFAGEERVAIGADFDFEHVAFDSRAGGEIVAAGAMDCYGVIIGMNTGFHEAPFVRVRSARLDLSREGVLHSSEKDCTPEGVPYGRVARSRSNAYYRGIWWHFQIWWKA
jgi:hypothetical protein